jgi:hypothetical protein
MSLYIIAEEHPWYYLFSDVSELKKLSHKILDREKEELARIRPDVVFVEYPDPNEWGIKEELKYRVPFFVLSMKRCGIKLSNERATDIIKSGYEERKKFYGEIRKNAKLVFMETKESYEKGGIAITNLWRKNSSEAQEEFVRISEEREDLFLRKIKNEKFNIGLVICGLSHAIKPSGSTSKWIKELSQLYEIEIIELRLETF